MSVHFNLSFSNRADKHFKLIASLNFCDFLPLTQRDENGTHRSGVRYQMREIDNHTGSAHFGLVIASVIKFITKRRL